MNKKKFRARCLICAVIMVFVAVFCAVAETASPAETAPAADVQEAAVVTAETASAEEGDPEINVIDGIVSIAKSTGFATGEWREYAMIVVACGLLYLAIVKQFEPLLLLPIAFGMLLANLPMGGVMDHATYTFYNTMEEAVAAAKALGKDAYDVTLRYNEATGMMQHALQTANGGLLYYLYQGVKLGIYPPIIFMGVGAMTDFGPLLANPKSLLLGAAAQLGVFLAFFAAKLLGFSANDIFFLAFLLMVNGIIISKCLILKARHHP